MDLASVEMTAALYAVLSARAHGVRGHLGTVRNSAYVLQKHLERDAAAPEPRIERAFGAIERAVAAIGDLETDATPPAGWAGAFAGTGVEIPVRAAAAHCRYGRPERLLLSLEHAVLPLPEHAVTIAVRAVLENAVEAGGPASSIRIEGAPRDDIYTLSVTDSGGGWQGVDAERALQPLVTTKPGRSGLGLTLARWICRQASGTLSIVNVPGGLRVELAFLTANPHGEP